MMTMSSDQALFLLSCVGCLVPILYYSQYPPTEKMRSKIVIGVLSKLENFERRKAIRSTWKKLVSEDAVFHFILGDTFCPHNKLWRLSNENCNEWKLEVFFFVGLLLFAYIYMFKVPQWIKDGEVLSLLEADKSQAAKNHKPYEGFSFRVMRFPIVFESLGILTSVLGSLLKQSNSTNVKIQLKDRYTDEIINQVSFNKTDIQGDTGGFAFKKLDVKNIPIVDFDGILSLKIEENMNYKMSSKLCTAVYDYKLGQHGLIHINGLVDGKVSTILPFSKYSCPLVSLKYKILDVMSLKRHYGAKQTQNSVEQKKVEELKRLLDREEEDFNDLVFLPVLDSKFNNSQKLKLYSKHLVENFDFNHLVLTEDSSFLFFNNIQSKLNKIASARLWWSDFDIFRKTNENVENFNDKYTSLTYPPITKTSLMTISHALLQYIAHNINYLKDFGSLQTSLGIWLSSIETRRYQDEFWTLDNCEQLTNLGDDESQLACVGLETKEMKKVWNKLRKRHYG